MKLVTSLLILVNVVGFVGGRVLCGVVEDYKRDRKIERMYKRWRLESA